MDRFMAYVIPEPNSGCWLWCGPVNRQGYGFMKVGATNKKAHRIAWELFHGPLPPWAGQKRGVVVRHMCHNTSCVNPDHLAKGTQKDNIADRDAAGRHRPMRGSDHHQSKVTERDVVEIRRLRAQGARVADIAARFGISKPQASAISTGRCWGHIT
jgi:hypothetical protein